MTDPMTMMDVTTDEPGAQGTGMDILEAARGDAMYSPICEVFTYDPDVDVDGHPIAKFSVGDLSAAEMASATPTGDLIYCLQVF